MLQMTANPPDSLQRLLAEEPFVRQLARTLLAEEQDEVVQLTWLQAVRHGGQGVDAPRSWLARIVQRVASNLRRRRDRRRRHEDGAALESLVPSSTELLAREEQRRLLVAVVDGLPAELRTVVLLRYFDGQPPRQIAAELGVPVTTVWNRLRRALQLLRERLDAQHGGERRTWMLALVPFAAGSREAAVATTAAGTATATLGLGVLVMTMKAKLAAAAAVLVTLAGAVLLWQRDDGLPTELQLDVAARDGSVPASGNLGDLRGAATPPPEPERREAVTPSATAPTTGSLVVHVRYGDDDTPAVGVTMFAWHEGTEPRFDGIRARTDATGTATFQDLLPGTVYALSDRAASGVPVEIVAGETTTLDFTFRDGMTIAGTVVSAAGTPVAGALVEVAWVGRIDADAECLAVTGPDGTFVVRAAPNEALVGARAEGHGSSRLQSLTGRHGSRVDVRLQLGPPAGAVEGFVVDGHDRPVADAAVWVGEGRTNYLVVWGDGGPPLPARVLTDQNGRFRAIGVLPGAQPVAVRARGFGLWTGTCEVQAHAAVPLRIVLQPGASLHGTVRNAEGAPVPGIEVEIGAWTDLAHHIAATNAGGQFVLRGLAAGPTTVRASHSQFGLAAQQVVCLAGESVPCDLLLSRGLELKGRVVDEEGAPIAEARVSANAQGTSPPWAESKLTDAEGRFALPNCPEGHAVDMGVSRRGFEPHRQQAVSVTDAPLELVLRRALPPSSKIRGIVVDAGGAPLANATVTVHRQGEESSQVARTLADGAFAFGPVVPGTWSATFVCNGRPTVKSGPHEVAPDTTWDLGNVALPTGGRAVVAIPAGGADVSLRIWDAVGQRPWGLTVTETPGERISHWLLPGDYRLFVSGKAVAAQSIPFVVRADETTRVPLDLVPGVPQAFAILPPAAGRAPRSVMLTIHRGEQLLVRHWATLQSGQPTNIELSLLPGDYRIAVATTDRELASTACTVGATEGPPLRLVLP